MKRRDLSLDFLRGLSIFGMIFSALVPAGVLPGWMYHIQNPPPSHQLDIQVAGIGWVDLVFPVFIFCMGAAIPLSGKEKIRTGMTSGGFIKSVLGRFGMLWLFSYLYVLLNYSDVEGIWPQILTLLGFCALFPLYMVFKGKRSSRYAGWIRLSALILVCGIIAAGHFLFGEKISLQRRGIIIFLLAFLYLFGSLIWYFTRDNLKIRAAIWGLILAFTLATQYAGLPDIAYSDPDIRWWFNPEYIYFLLLLLPSTYIGEILWKRRNEPSIPEYSRENGSHWTGFSIFALLLLWTIWACYAFYMRLYWWNLGVGVLGWWALRYLISRNMPEYKTIFTVGAYLLFCGMIIDNMDGGIKKVPCTISYCLAAGGLSIFLLLVSMYICRHFPDRFMVGIFSGAGRNPLMGYIAFGSLVMPLMKATGLIFLYRAAYPPQYPAIGVLRAAVITIFTMWIVSRFSRKKVFWKA